MLAHAVAGHLVASRVETLVHLVRILVRGTIRAHQGAPYAAVVPP